MSSLALTNVIIRQGKQPILHVESANVKAGEFIAVVGPNGAGKTSLFRAISTEWRAESGRIELHERAIDDWPRRLRACHLGVLPQSTQLTFPFNAREVVAIGATPLQLSSIAREKAVRVWMEKTDTWQFADRLYTDLSGGERQRVQLARVLLQVSQAQQTPVLLLDEPTSAQDLGQQHHLLQLVRELSLEQQFSVIAILHDLNQACRYADKLWLLDKGRMVSQGRPCDVLTPSVVESIWGYSPEQLHTQAGHSVLI